MPIQLQIGSDIYIIPEQGDNPDWGDDTTAYLEAIADALETVQGPNDILLTSATLSNNQASFADIPGFNFNAAEVQSLKSDYLVIRIYDSGATTVTESGTISGNYDGTDFYIASQTVGDAGVEFEITAAGQMQYKTSDLSNHVSSVIRFEGRSIDAP